MPGCSKTQTSEGKGRKAWHTLRIWFSSANLNLCVWDNWTSQDCVNKSINESGQGEWINGGHLSPVTIPAHLVWFLGDSHISETLQQATKNSPSHCQWPFIELVTRKLVNPSGSVETTGPLKLWGRAMDKISFLLSQNQKRHRAWELSSRREKEHPGRICQESSTKTQKRYLHTFLQPDQGRSRLCYHLSHNEKQLINLLSFKEPKPISYHPPSSRLITHYPPNPE